MKRSNLAGGVLVALAATLGWAAGSDRLSLPIARTAAAEPAEQPVTLPLR